MIKPKKISKFKKVVALYLAMMILLETFQPMQMYALTSGPKQPEFSSFTPIDTSDMVDLTSGDFNYNIPIMDVGGYPLNLAYNSGITMDQEASWVGLGWNLNVGQIERQVRGLPDDFRGDEMIYENYLKQNRTVGINVGVNAAYTGFDALQLGVGLGVESNNYEGISFKPSYGIGFNFNGNVSVGMDFSSSLDGGASVTPRIGISTKINDTYGTTTSLGSSISLGFNSRKGVENLNVSASVSQMGKGIKDNQEKQMSEIVKSKGGTSTGGSISFNNLSYTPTKRIGFRNENFSFNGALGGEVFGVEGQVQVTGYGSYQTIADEYRNRKEKGYGYENTEYKKTNESGVLDFNRENERVVTENTLALPVTNYTYDTYNIDGQGAAGMFRPYRSKVSSVYNDEVVDLGKSQNFGVEVGLGNLFHASGDFKKAPSESTTGGWIQNNNVLAHFNEKNTDKKEATYEPITFKMVGATIVDPETIYKDKIYEATPLRIDIDGNKKNTFTSAYTFAGGKYGDKEIKRTKRFLRSQVIQKVTSAEAARDKFIIKNSNAKSHHTAGIKVLQTDGTTYVYGETAYNTKKAEATFDVSGQTGDNTKGLVGYNGSLYGNGNNTSDQFVNRVITPAYAHTYLLSTVLSSDYQDIDDNGPTVNDLGAFTKFEYTTVPAIYKWRVPFEANKATYNEGLISKKDDQKGNYLYGEKELKYLDKIVTKSHVAFFDLEDRKDAIGVAGENGGAGTERMKKLHAIRLYSRPEVTDASGAIFDPTKITGSNVKPIKTAHFVYSYNICKGMPNNDKSAALTPNELSNKGGKLTLEKVYFTYRGSNMGKYTPYVFNYGSDDTTDNPNYDMKGFDIWGNYKENPINSGYINTPLSNTEFPFVDQNKSKVNIEKTKNQADINTASWNLKSVRLPSGGEITIETESDDYQYVQNKKAMQMYKVVGVGHNIVPTSDDIKNKDILYNGSSHKKFLYVKLSDNNLVAASDGLTKQKFLDGYLSENLNKVIQFKFMLNMSDNKEQFEYVSGYFKIGNANEIDVKYSSELGGTIASIPVEFLSKDKGNGNMVNPIAKAGWGFGRTFLNRLTCGINDNPSDTDFSSIVKNLRGSLSIIKEIFDGPDGYLQGKGRARIFKPEKSWVRLENSDGHKLGGGLRVKSIKLSDNWTKMLEGTSGTKLNDMEYGQTYSYNDEKGNSSGVATFEPNMCAENPFVEPFYNAKGNYAETVAAPMESNYVEKPFGANFFPAPRVTYARVTVKNLDKKDSAGTIIVKKHATGSVVTSHYTSYDFPTKVSYTDLKMINGITPTNIVKDMLKNIIRGGNIDVRNLLTMTQGYSIETNDMNGKIRMQEVYNEANEVISSVEYKYNIDEQGNLDNNITTIDEKGNVAKRIIGVDYDLINDFNRSFAKTETSGFKANVAGFLIPVGIFPIPIFIPTVFPESSTNINELRTAVTTKHVHKTAILVEKIAKDLGAVVSTKNLGWDASSGEVLLTETVNEYSDHYYSFNFPAYWMYDGMGAASQNIGIEGKLIANATTSSGTTVTGQAGNPYFKLDNYSGDISKIFHVGDELAVDSGIIQSPGLFGQPLPPVFKLWIVGFNSDKTGVLLMDRNGNYLNKCEDLGNFNFKIVRSGYRNMSNASMASITSMINPIKNGKLDQDSFQFNASSSFNPRIVNASAVVYNDYWNTQLESILPYYPNYNSNSVASHRDPITGNIIIDIDLNPISPSGDVKYPNDVKVNPYVWNIKGNWRAEKSYAYLTGRNSKRGNTNNPRNEGFFTSFNSFYKLDRSAAVPVWKIDESNWTYASSVSQYSPYGAELENKDALERYSSAQYGYMYKLPMAVASNAKYKQIGYDGFEEKKTVTVKKHFGFAIDKLNIDSNQSHTGKNSLKVAKGTSSTMTRNLYPTIKTTEEAKCPSIPVECFMCGEIGCPTCPSTAIFPTPDQINSLYTPICIDLGLGFGTPGSSSITYSSINYCLKYPNNGGSAKLVAKDRINLTPASNQIMYLTIHFPQLSPSIPADRDVYVKITFNNDGTWTHTCLRDFSKEGSMTCF
ncbi:hypothetical protein J2Y38_002284 [Flavobacterium sp. 2755]|uniref:hypothetical protein n=1 Tax=Flavobacterium sp. 2755 TaxID=2817765 RepID=UPI0028668B4F|nr:hypothetical protein [Flavobacterium sp. 2755]MDR6762073.1 hypothetical protein [Flavobacterium sp. 2755]